MNLLKYMKTEEQSVKSALNAAKMVCVVVVRSGALERLKEKIPPGLSPSGTIHLFSLPALEIQHW